MAKNDLQGTLDLKTLAQSGSLHVSWSLSSLWTCVPALRASRINLAGGLHYE